MSKISIEGNASGTGTLTIAAPNTNTNYTLALPEEAGTITTSNSPYSTFRNRIINGDMRIDQRNAGASVTVNTGPGPYSVDRWTSFGQTSDGVFTLQQNAGSVTPPAGFVNYLGATVTTADASIGATQVYRITQFIEGLNCADLSWGTANAKTITLSFWVRSSLTGTFGGSLGNNGFTRAYPFNYTISAANTWEYKTVTIAGDTTGTWLTTNGIGIAVSFVMGMGATYTGTANAWNAGLYFAPTGTTNIIATNGATFYITGVQLEVGSVATPFERRPYGTELSLCQRYYYKISGDSNTRFGIGYVVDGTRAYGMTTFPTTMRTSPTSVEQTGTAANYGVLTGVTATTCSSVPTFNVASEWSAMTQFTVSSGLTAAQSIAIRSLTAGAYLAWSAEL